VARLTFEPQLHGVQMIVDVIVAEGAFLEQRLTLRQMPMRILSVRIRPGEECANCGPIEGHVVTRHAQSVLQERMGERPVPPVSGQFRP
jgi:hypothetical protein